MAATLSAIFELVDRVSAPMKDMADTGLDALDKMERMAVSIDTAFDSAESGGKRVATACDGVATAAQSAGGSIEDSAESTDYWTDAIGNYSKEACTGSGAG